MKNTLFTQKQQSIIFSILSFYILAIPLILFDYNSGRAFSDQVNFHLPTILHFIKQFDFTDYPSATTPGYHIILAIFGKIFVVNDILFKLINSIFTITLIGILANLLFNNFGKIKTLILLLPMIFSIYIFPSGVWLLPDNLAWLTVAIVLIISIKIHLSNRQYILLSIFLVFAVLVRQPNLWLAATVWSTGLAYWLYEKQQPSSKYISILFKCIVSTFPAFIILILFYLKWNGLVPPSFQNIHEHISFSVPAFFFALFFIYSIFYVPIILKLFLSSDISNKYLWVFLGLFLGFIVSIIPDTSYSFEFGRFSGLWNLVKFTPEINNKSLLIILFSTLGGGVFFGILSIFDKKFRFVIIVSTLAFIVAQMSNAFVYERYFSGYIFIIIFILLSQLKEIKQISLSKWVWSLPLLFALLNIFILIHGIF